MEKQDISSGLVRAFQELIKKQRRDTIQDTNRKVATEEVDVKFKHLEPLKLPHCVLKLTTNDTNSGITTIKQKQRYWAKTEKAKWQK